MSEYEARVEMARLNRNLADLWLEEVDLYEIHHSTATDFENRVVRAVNDMYRQSERCKSVICGSKLREVYGYE